MSGPHERIKAYLEESEETKGDWIDAPIQGSRSIAGGRVALYGTPLTVSDLRDEVEELDAHIELLIDIDKVLDQDMSAEAAIAEIRNLMGNHTNGR